MNRHDLDYGAGALLAVSVLLTGLTGLLAAELDLHRFVPHKYFAFTTLGLAAAHLCFNLPKLWRYWKARRAGRG